MAWDIRFGSFMFLGSFVVLVILVVAGVFMRRPLADGTALLTPRRLVEAYVFTVLLVSMLLVSSGVADLVRAGIAKKAGMETSYRPEPVYDANRKPNEEPRFEYDPKAPRRDAFSGVAELGVGLLVGLLHLLGLGRMNRTEPVGASPVYRLFLIIGLIIYTATVLILAVASVKDTLVYRYVGAPPLRWMYQRPLPGDQIAGLVGFLPLWAVLVHRLFRYARPHTTA